jgi:iron complex outermembrane receptor protein
VPISGGFTVSSSRGFDFNVFGSELFNRINIQKTQRASIEEGGIAGTVDLYSGRPFDRPGARVVLSGQGSYNTVTRKVDPHIATVFSDTFLDGKVGVLLSTAYSKRTVIRRAARASCGPARRLTAILGRTLGGVDELVDAVRGD